MTDWISGLTLGPWGILILSVAGLVSGALNAAAGGGSLVTFPVLLGVGYPPIVANVTNNVAAWPGYVGGAWGYKNGLAGQAHRAIPLALVSVLGGVIGVGLLLVSSPAAFESLAPFLVLAACGILAAEPTITRRMNWGRVGAPGAGTLVAWAAASVYGGYFGAALGVALLAMLGLAFKDTLQRLNALKTILQLVIGTTTAIGLSLLTPVAWEAVAIVGFASLIGGQLGAKLAQKLDDRVLRAAIVAYGVFAALWLFCR